MEAKKLRNIYICFPEGKHKVLTMSYDDGREEDRRLIALFNRYGIKGTFHVNSGITGDNRIPLSEYRTLYEGHEVSCHTYTHPTIARCPLEQVAEQIIEDRRELERAVGYPVRGMSYPNGSYSKEIMDLLPALGIRYSRIVGNSEHFAMPENYLEWKATCHHNHNLLRLGEEFINLYKTQYLYMMYVWGHSYEFTQMNNWSVMEDFCKLVGQREDIWYATNIQIVDYMDAADRLQFTISGDLVYNPSFQSVWISVDNQIIEIKGGQTVSLF
ncbi:MAG TPA: polysaccharide deacetylase [Lachnospiraceae bacterium]|nr:polysaccharide deacetylase [Lachnospiraceae bacterium]